MPCKRFFLSVVSWSCHSKDDCCRLARICVLKKICTFIDTRSPKAKASPRRLAGLSSGTASAFTEPGDVCGPITSKTPVKVYHGHGDNANVINNTSLYMYLSFMIRDTYVGLSYVQCRLTHTRPVLHLYSPLRDIVCFVSCNEPHLFLLRISSDDLKPVFMFNPNFRRPPKTKIGNHF